VSVKSKNFVILTLWERNIGFCKWLNHLSIHVSFQLVPIVDVLACDQEAFFTVNQAIKMPAKVAIKANFEYHKNLLSYYIRMTINN